MPSDLLYHLNVVDRTGFFLGELPDAILTSAKWELNGPGELVYDLPQNSEYILLPQENVNEVQLWIGDNPAATDCDLWAFHHKTVENPRKVTFTCPGVLAYFDHFFVWNDTLQIPFPVRDPKLYDTSQDYLNPTYGVPHLVPNVQFSNQEDILAFLVTYFQDGADRERYIGVDTLPVTNTPRTMLYKREDHQNAMDIIQAFSTYTDGFGTPTGMDIKIAYHNQGKWFQMIYPSGGTVNYGTIFEWGKNVIDYTVNKDGSAMANRVIATGGTANNVKFEQQFRNGTSATTYGEWQDVVSGGDEKDPASLLGTAQKEAITRADPVVTVDVTAVEVPDALLGKIGVGDWIRVVIDHGRTNVDTYYRIQTINWLPGPGNLKVGLALV